MRLQKVLPRSQPITYEIEQVPLHGDIQRGGHGSKMGGGKIKDNRKKLTFPPPHRCAVEMVEEGDLGELLCSSCLEDSLQLVF